MESETKYCSKCDKTKLLTEFYYIPSHGCYASECKICSAIMNKKYREKNPEKIRKNNKKWGEENKEKQKEINALWREKNKEYIKIKNKKHYQDNKETYLTNVRKYRSLYPEIMKDYRRKNKNKLSKQHQEYYEKNRSKINTWTRKHRRERYKTDTQYRIAMLLRGRFRSSIKGKYKSNSSINLLGISISKFKKYFESKFIKDMSWDKFLSGEIHIDHIIPCVAFDLARDVDQQTCFHYTNLQPLWASDNIKKDTNFDL